MPENWEWSTDGELVSEQLEREQPGMGMTNKTRPETNIYYIVEKFDREHDCWRLACAARDSEEKSRVDKFWKREREGGTYRVVKITETREILDAY